MPRILIQAVHSNGQPRRWTLSERIVAENLTSDHYVTQLIDRLSWATADAEALESRSADLVSDDDGAPPRSKATTGSGEPNTSGHLGSRRVAPDALVSA
jgi:hypothetical protein